MDFIQQLVDFGLSSKTASAYVALLKLQSATAHQVAVEAKTERTTIYKILEELVEKGLASKSIHGKRITYIAEQPLKLKQLVERQERILGSLIPSLNALPGKTKDKPVVQFYNTTAGIKEALMNTLDCKEKLRRDFASVDDIVDFLGQRFINHQIEERVKRGIYVQSLRTQPTKAKNAEKEWYLKKDNNELLREVRYLPKEYSVEPVIFIHDNTITVVSSEKESYALVIKSLELSQAMKALFDIAWKIGK